MNILNGCQLSRYYGVRGRMVYIPIAGSTSIIFYLYFLIIELLAYLLPSKPRDYKCNELNKALLCSLAVKLLFNKH